MFQKKLICDFIDRLISAIKSFSNSLLNKMNYCLNSIMVKLSFLKHFTFAVVIRQTKISFNKHHLFYKITLNSLK